eukprot:sb/3477451/
MRDLDTIWEHQQHPTGGIPLTQQAGGHDPEKWTFKQVTNTTTPRPWDAGLNTLLFQLTSMQKAYHDLKEQALRMSIEQDAQKNQIEAEINKLKVSNQELINKNQVREL